MNFDNYFENMREDLETRNERLTVQDAKESISTFEDLVYRLDNTNDYDEVVDILTSIVAEVNSIIG